MTMHSNLDRKSVHRTIAQQFHSLKCLPKWTIKTLIISKIFIPTSTRGNTDLIAGGCGTHFCWYCKVIWPYPNGRPTVHHLELCRNRRPSQPSVSRPLLEDGQPNLTYFYLAYHMTVAVRVLNPATAASSRTSFRGPVEQAFILGL